MKFNEERPYLSSAPLNLRSTWGQNGGVLQASAVLAGLAGLISGIAYLSKECAPLTKTPAAQGTDLGKLSSKLQAGSSQKD